MEILFYVLVVAGCLAAVANLVVLVYLSAFLVNLKTNFREFFGDLTQVLLTLEQPPPPTPKPTRRKTWDEAYMEEEIAREIARRREAGGLIDPGLQTGNWGLPPQPSEKAQEGLNVQNQLPKLEQ